MHSKDMLPELMQTLPAELKLRTIYWGVKTDGAIISTSTSAKQEREAIELGRPIIQTDSFEHQYVENPLEKFSATPELQELATKEFWKANVFQVISDNYYETNDPWYIKDPWEIKSCAELLNDDASRRPFARNLELRVLGGHSLRVIEDSIEDTIGVGDVGVMHHVREVYPKLESLSIKVLYHIGCLVSPDDREPCGVRVWEQQHFLMNIIRELRKLNVKHKSISLEQCDGTRIEPVFEAIEIDGRGQELSELVYQMMDCVNSVVTLS